jgi:hypothetical protein
LQALQDTGGGTWLFPGRVQVLHAHQPGATAVAGVEKTGEGGNE